MYIFDHFSSIKVLQNILLNFLEELKVIDLDKEVAVNAINSKIKDTEDALHYYAALHHNLDFFISNDKQLKKETIIQKSKSRNLEIIYPTYQEATKMYLPNEINIKAAQQDIVTIDIAYKNITINEKLNFSFSISLSKRLIV